MDESAERAPWTIKSVPVAERRLASACAVKQGQPMGEWIARAIRTQANIEAGERVFPPGSPAAAPVIPNAMTAELERLVTLLRALRRFADAAGTKLPEALVRQVFTLTRTVLAGAPAPSVPRLPPPDAPPEQM